MTPPCVLELPAPTTSRSPASGPDNVAAHQHRPYQWPFMSAPHVPQRPARGGPATLTLTLSGDAAWPTIRAELSGLDPNPETPQRAQWGPLRTLAPVLRRHGITAHGLVRALVAAGWPFAAISAAAGDMVSA